MFCDQCGTPLPEQARFCPNCGAPCASAPKLPESTPKADTASAAAQADAQNAFSPAAEAGAKSAQPSDVPRRKQKKIREKNGKPRQPLWAWFKSHRRLTGILLCVVLVLMILLVIDFLRGKIKPECPDPFTFFGLSEDADTYSDPFDLSYPSTMDEQTALAAINSYTDLIRNEYDGTVLYFLDQIQVSFFSHSQLFCEHRIINISYSADENRWYVSYGYSCDEDDFKFVPVEPYQAAGIADDDPTGQQDAATVPDASSNAAEDETTTPTEPEVVERPVLEGAVVPDFKAFCNGNVYENRVTEDKDNTECVYFWYYNGKAQAEYIELLEDYDFVLRAASEDDGNEKYAFDYVGDDGDVAAFDSKQGGKKFKESTTDISLFIWSLHYGNGESEIHISFADGVTYADTGDRTTRELTPYYGDDADASSSSSSGDSDWHKDVLDCLTCGGSGDCTQCDGYGFIYRYTVVDGKSTTLKSLCPKCYGNMKCTTCGGSGKR